MWPASGFRRFGLPTALAAVAAMLAIPAIEHLRETPQELVALPPMPVMRFTVPIGEGQLSPERDGSSDAISLGGVSDALWGRPASTSLALSNDGNVNTSVTSDEQRIY